MHLSFPRILLGVLIGATLGAAVIVTERMALVGYFNPKLLSVEQLPWWWVAGVLLFFWIHVSIVFAICIVLIGFPAWTTLNILRPTSNWLSAICLGAVLAPISYVLFIRFGLLPRWVGPFTGAATGAAGTGAQISDLYTLFGDAACLFVAGALAGLVIWAVSHSGSSSK